MQARSRSSLRPTFPHRHNWTTCLDADRRHATQDFTLTHTRTLTLNRLGPPRLRFEVHKRAAVGERVAVKEESAEDFRLCGFGGRRGQGGDGLRVC